jgi:predicted peptidase
MTRLLPFSLLFLIALSGTAQTGVLDPQDPIVIYDPAHPPALPPVGTLAKWVKTNRVAWNTTSFKCYMYNGIAFRLKFPKSYSPGADGKTYPLYLFFHGIGEAGIVFDNEYQLFHGGDVHGNAVNGGTFDGFLLYPQSPGGWGQGQLNTIASLVTKYLVPMVKVDAGRVVVSGISAGGDAAWRFAASHPELTAACMPISSVSIGAESDVTTLRNIPIWLFQGGLDMSPAPVTAKVIVNYYKAAGANITFTEYPTLGHGCWDSAWKEPGYFPFLRRAHK